MTSAADYSKYQGHAVSITKVSGAVITGRAVVANAAGFLIKIPNKSNNALVTINEIAVVQRLAEPRESRKPRKIRAKHVHKVSDDLTRPHLADRHGVQVSVLNQMDHAEAVELHEALHREYGSDLGHIHGRPPPKEERQRQRRIQHELEVEQRREERRLARLELEQQREENSGLTPYMASHLQAGEDVIEQLVNGS